ncbi:hypothetical protein Q8A67_021949 [Cirrhinus molitorella]|uniref:Uncharacterized protein n=1 Tax=Cirrhinus molitorella TaxID=172907 RepID=A0AA88TEX8_9TELE|nr:hypothetical protein Q8A67_021949 [Cirrhinus molitorella]
MTGSSPPRLITLYTPVPRFMQYHCRISTEANSNLLFSTIIVAHTSLDLNCTSSSRCPRALVWCSLWV